MGKGLLIAPFLMQAQSTSPLDAVPLDEDSQQVLGMLARSMSESQHAGPAPGMQQTSRLAMELLGTDPGSTLLRGPSFVGRQQTVARSQSTAALGLGGSRSFIFGRSENSNSAMGTDAVSSAPLSWP